MNAYNQLAATLSAELAAVNHLILARLETRVPMIADVAAHLINAGGKRLRPLLTLACARMTGDATDKVYLHATAVEFIHTASLLHDDVVDGSQQRRGKLAAHMVFGAEASVLVGDFLFAQAFNLLVEHGDMIGLGILAQASAEITQGEVDQLQWKGNLEIQPENYFAIVRAKTSALFSAACEVGGLAAGEQARAALRAYGDALGMAYQLSDDVMDYLAAPEDFSKQLGDDLHEGKLTLPVIYALQAADQAERAFWQQTIAAGQAGAEIDWAQALQYLHTHQVFIRIQRLAADYAQQACAALAVFGEGPLARQLAAIAQATAARIQIPARQTA